MLTWLQGVGVRLPRKILWQEQQQVAEASENDHKHNLSVLGYAVPEVHHDALQRQAKMSLGGPEFIAGGDIAELWEQIFLNTFRTYFVS